jgi:acetylornithine deacetylase
MSQQFTCAQVQEAVRSLGDEALQWLQDMIEFESVQGNEAEVQAYTKQVMEQIGLTPQYREIPDSLMGDPEYSHNENEMPYAGRYNVVDTWGADEGRSVILQSHTDVIPGGEWQEAFTPRFDSTYVYGRGATDCKGSVVMMILALAALKKLGFEPRGRIESQFVIEEEVGGNGALALIRQGCKADAVIIGEGSLLNVFPANRGALWFKLTTYGKSLHMGRRNEGVNAIEKMMEAARHILDYEQELIRESLNYPLFERYEAPVQICLGMISAGNWPSMVPDECTMEGGVGFLPNKSKSQIEHELEQAILRTDDEWLRGHYKLTFDKLRNDAYESDPNHPLVVGLYETAVECGLDSEIFGWNVSCDARLYAKLGGMTTMVYGPGTIADAHAAGEKVEWRQVTDGAAALALTLSRWCG